MDLQKIFKSIKKTVFLPLIPTLMIAVPSFLLLIWVFADLSVPQSICYAAYVLSSYALIITCTGVFRLTKWFRSEMEENYLVKKLKGISFVERYVKESAFRAEISLYPGLFINLLYAGLKLFSGICYRSVWFGTLAVYYILLAVMRFSLLHHVRTKEAGDAAFRQRMTALTGTAVCLIVPGMALAIIIRTTVQIGNIKNGNKKREVRERGKDSCSGG